MHFRDATARSASSRSTASCSSGALAPDDALAAALAAPRAEVHRIGDCVAPRTFEEAFHEATAGSRSRAAERQTRPHQLHDAHRVARREAAVDGQRHARDERGVVGGEEQRRARDLLGAPEAPELVLLADPLAVLPRETRRRPSLRNSGVSMKPGQMQFTRIPIRP